MWSNMEGGDKSVSASIAVEMSTNAPDFAFRVNIQGNFNVSETFTWHFLISLFDLKIRICRLTKRLRPT